MLREYAHGGMRVEEQLVLRVFCPVDPALFVTLNLLHRGDRDVPTRVIELLPSV